MTGIRDFMACKIGDTFDITNDYLANWISTTTRYTSRFNVWCNDDKATCKTVLDAVKECGMSPALFVAKECVEGYNASWGWHNHTTPQGNYLQDAKFVASYTVGLDGSQQTPAWDDPGAGTVGVVPASVQAEGNAEYASWGNDTIGKKYACMTAASAWAIWYPQALQASVNGVQNYGNPLQQCYDLIFGEWGGKMNGETVDSGITSGGASNTTTDTKADKQAVKEAILKLFDNKIQQISPQYASNGKISIQLMFNGMMKPDITDEALSEIVTTINGSSTSGGAGDNAGTSAGNGTVSSGNSEKVQKALEALAGQIGNTLGSGQCYAMSAWYAVQISGYTCDYSVPGTMLSAIGDTYNACNLWSGWQWSQAGAQVAGNSDIKAGDIFCIKPYYGQPFVTGVWGHTGVVEKIEGGVVTVLEQNYAGRQYVVRNTYSESVFKDAVSGWVRWN